MKKIFLLLLYSIGFTLICQAQQSGDNDPSFNPDDIGFGNGSSFDTTVYSTVLQSDGRIIVGGNFSQFNGYSRNKIARLNSIGSLDFSFDPGTGFDYAVSSVVIQSNDKIVAGGSFTLIDGTTQNRIARLNSDGSLDQTFNIGTGFNHIVTALALQQDDKIIVGGYFSSFNGTTINKIVRLSADGSIDVSFNTSLVFNANDIINAIAIQADGKIVIGGSFTNFNGTTLNNIARLNSDGTVDATFNNPGTGCNGIVSAINLQSDEKIIVGGSFTNYSGNPLNYIARLNVNGSIDLSFNTGTGFNTPINALAIQTNDKVLVGGSFSSFNGTATNCLARLNSNGSIDGTFNIGNGFNSQTYSFAIQPNGKIIVGGKFYIVDGTAREHIAQLNSDGSLDIPFNPGTGFNNFVNAIVLQNDGKILVGGWFSIYNGNSANRIIRLDENGYIDFTFNSDLGFDYHGVNAIVVQPDGKIIVGGEFYNYNGNLRSCIVRLNSDGSIDTGFNPGSGFSDGSGVGVYALALQQDGKIICGGKFTTYDGTSANYIIRLNSDGSIDATFNTGTGFSSYVTCLALQSDGKIIAGGWFTSYNGSSCNRIVRLNTDGSFDASFVSNTGFDDYVNTNAIQSDGKIIVGGNFNTYDGNNRKKIVRLNTDGSIDAAFNTGLGFSSYTKFLLLQPDNKILVGGNFTTYNGTNRKYISRLHSDGSLDLTFDPGTGFDSQVRALALQTDAKVIVGGIFISFDAIGRNRIARLFGDFTTEINQDEFENIVSIYPNPATTEIIVNGYSPAYLKLCNAVGQIVAESKSNKLYVGNLSQGLYVLQLFDANGQQVKTEKVIVAK